MKLKEIVDQFNDSEIIKRLLEIYPDQEKSKSGYLRVLTTLRKLEPAKSTMTIFPRKFNTDAYDSKDKETYAIEFTRWQVWLGSEIKTHKDKLSALCNCLWEMTYMGYSQQPIQRQMGEMMRNIEKIKKEEKVAL
jgi:hypothetical protein